MKSLFEQMGGTYHEENGYLIPNFLIMSSEVIITSDFESEAA